MRDPSRIDDVLRLIEEVWRREPDLRLGQLIINAQRMTKTHTAEIDPYELEDDDLAKGLMAYRDLRRAKAFLPDT